jgi:type 1 glutamine amidotransferase
MRHSLVWLMLVATLVSCRSDRVPTAPDDGGVPGGPAVRVLMVTATQGFRHDAIAVAQQVTRSLAARAGDVSVTVTEDLSALDGSQLAAYDVVFFALTSGELPLRSDQRDALLAFVNGGRGFVGVHSATDTLYGWSEYGDLIGAYFSEHPWTQTANVLVEDRTHPTTRALGDRFTIFEEFYTFRDNPRPRVQVLLRLDAASVGASGDYPLAWAHTFGAGRVYYNALGHFPGTWTDARFQEQLLTAFRWVAKRL